MNVSITDKEALEILNHNWTRLVNSDYTDIELGQAQDTAIKALEVVDAIKKAFITNAVGDTLNFDIASSRCYIDTTYHILCDAYGTEESMNSWIKEYEG
jgi:hypothetical protein